MEDKLTEDKPEAVAAGSESPQPAKRRRGRPRKVVPADEQGVQASDERGGEAPAEQPKRGKRARTRKPQAQDEQREESRDAKPQEQPRREARETHAEALRDVPEGAPREGDGTSSRPGRSRAYQQAPRSHQPFSRQQQGSSRQVRPGRGQQAQGNNRRRNFTNNNRHANASANEPSLSREDCLSMRVAELRSQAVNLGIEYVGLHKAELAEAVFVAAARAEGFRSTAGVLDITSEGYGFVRTGNYMPGDDDAFVPQQLIKHLGLRRGDWVEGTVRPSRPNDKYPALQKVSGLNGVSPDVLRDRPRFRDLTPVYPNVRLTMEHGKDSITGRAIDLVAPIGKGQRGLIVSPPKAGKTTILKDIAASISANNPEVHLMCLLVDERPEEVTDMQRSIKGDVVASTFDMPADNHTRVSELVIERAKRLVECGKDVVILLDSLTRLARAYNLAQPASGRILSGGVDSTALYPPKRFLGAARNIEHGGSLTILASALVDTGSKMDEVIFEEFKGTGNMELKLDRTLADRRIFPAIDPVASGTRKEDLLLNPQEAPLIWAVRRILANTNSTERAMDMLIKSLKQTETNQEFLIRTAKKAQHDNKGSIAEF